MEEEKKKRVSTSGIRVFELKKFAGEWVFVVYDKTGDLFWKGGFASEADARANITQLKKVFRNRFLSVKTIQSNDR